MDNDGSFVDFDSPEGQGGDEPGAAEDAAVDALINAEYRALLATLHESWVSASIRDVPAFALAVAAHGLGEFLATGKVSSRDKDWLAQLHFCLCAAVDEVQKGAGNVLFASAGMLSTDERGDE